MDISLAGEGVRGRGCRGDHSVGRDPRSPGTVSPYWEKQIGSVPNAATCWNQRDRTRANPLPPAPNVPAKSSGGNGSAGPCLILCSLSFIGLCSLLHLLSFPPGKATAGSTRPVQCPRTFAPERIWARSAREGPGEEWLRFIITCTGYIKPRCTVDPHPRRARISGIPTGCSASPTRTPSNPTCHRTSPKRHRAMQPTQRLRRGRGETGGLCMPADS
eukprot:gene16016-biopygen9759